MNPGTPNLLLRAARPIRLPRSTRLCSWSKQADCITRDVPICASSLCTAKYTFRHTNATSSFSRPSPRRLFHASSNLSATKNPYAVLGVDKTATAGDIKKAYYGLAKKYHPDTNKDATAKDKFAEAQSAYEILTDPKKKETWDQYGAAAFDQGAGPGPGGDPFAGGGPFGGAAAGGGFGGFGAGGFGADFSFEDLFKQFGGQQARRGRSGRGSPFQQEELLVGESIEVQMNISFMEAAKGINRSITITPLTACKTCSGSGLKSGTKRSECKSCNGTGTRVHFMQGGFQMASTCGVCGGQGVTIPKGSECRTCSGDGVVRERKTMNIDIPAGIEDGMKLRLDQEGDAPIAGSAINPNARTIRGDLYVYVRVATDSKFSRSGSDVLYTATIPLTTAVLGGEVKIPTLDGEVNVKVATGTGTGDKITLSGMGMKKLNTRRNGSGDLKVEFKVAMPKYLSANQRTIVEMLAEEMDDKTAKRMMNIGRSSSVEASGSSHTSDSEKNEGFLKSLWNKVTADDGVQTRDETPPSSTSGGSKEGIAKNERLNSSKKD